MLFVNETQLTEEEKDYAEKIYLLFENNMEYYVRWFEPEYEHHIKPFSEELQTQVREYLKDMTLPQLMQTSRLHGMNVLHHLVVKNMKEEVRWLIEQGADPNSRCVHTPGSPASFGYKNMTPLHFACILGNYEMVELLVSLGADPTLVDDNGRGCQHYLGGVVNQVSVGRFLYKEVTPQREQIARFLKLDMNKLDKNGWSPFNYVCKTGQFIDDERIKRMTEIYLELGMDPSKPSSLGIPLCYAISDRNTALFGMMARTGAPLDIQDEDGNTLAHWVIDDRNGDHFLVYLYYKGVDFSIPNKKGETVNEYLERVDNDVYKILLKAERKRTVEDYIKLAGEFDRRWDTDPFCDEMRCFFVKKAIALIDPDDNKDVLLVKKLINESGDITDVIEALHECDFDFRMPLFEGSEVTYLRDLILDFSEYWSVSVPKLVECGVDINEALDGKTSPIYNMIYNSLTYSGYSEKNLTGAIGYFSSEALDMPCEKGASALHLLSAMGEIPEALEEALSTGADVNATAVSPARDGDTPLHVACRTKNLPMIQVLVAAGADDTLTNDAGEDDEEDEEEDYDDDYDEDVEYDEEYFRHYCMDFSEEREDDEEDEEEERDREATNYASDKVFERFATLMTPLFARFNHRMSVKLTPVREKTTVFDSKLGGVPYMPKDFDYPTVKEGEYCGKPLRFLAQLNFNTLPHLEFFPRKGILQFFAGCDGDELYGIDFENSTSQNCWRVIYHAEITEDVTKLYSAEDMPEFKDADNYPFEGEFLLKNSNPSLMKLTSTDYRFEEALVSACNETFGTSYERVFGPYDEKSVFHCEEALCDKVYEIMQEQMNEYGTRMGGYPYFTQEDPRSQDDSVKRDILLLQIDSDDEIMWGDCGVANFFISEEDLENKDFTDVLYNWDCC